MLGIKQLFKIDNKSKIFKEYNSLVLLEDKRFHLQGRFGTINKDIQTQKSILENNLKTLGKLYEEEGSPSIIKNFLVYLHIE